jgi:transcriptional regulator with XRE-family HTH domain
MRMSIGQRARDAHNALMTFLDMLNEILATGMTQTQLAERIGVTQPTVSRWKREGRPSKTDHEKAELLRALHQQLMGLTNETGTSSLRAIIAVCGGLGPLGKVNISLENDKVTAVLPMRIPGAHIAIEATSDQILLRARKGDLLIFGEPQAVETLSDQDVLITFVNWEGEVSTYYAPIRHMPGTDSILIGGQVPLPLTIGDVREARPFIGLIAAAQWRLHD